MRILYLDIDTLRPDHMGCYGYHRDTSPNIDKIARQGVRFEKCYVSDAPCLPSRASMFTGQFGIHNGVVNHGGVASDMRIMGKDRDFNTDKQAPGFVQCLWKQGIHGASFSSFAQRHSAWWFCANWREFHNPGHYGGERAEVIVPHAIDWIDRNAKRDNWMLHVHVWDPHTNYRTPDDYGNPFENQPLAGWYTEEMRRKQWDSYGPASPQEPGGSYGEFKGNPRQPEQIRSMADYKKHIDGYDVGIHYADMWCGRVLDALAKQGVLDDTVVIVTSDHGENQGELGVIGDHATADHITSRVPMIIRWPGIGGGPRTDDALHYQTDIAATIVELAGGKVPAHWDGQSFANAFRNGQSQGRDYIVFSQCAWSCQRGVRWGDNVFIRTYHSGFKPFPQRMLFNVAADPHELNDLALKEPQLADHGQALIEEWTSQMMATSRYDVDPLWTVMHEGGPYHASVSVLPQYCARLRASGRKDYADFLEKHPTGF